MENRKKTCYICLPISGCEDTAIYRANVAANYVKLLGMVPLTPMEVNDESQETLDNADRPIEFFMGNDIRTIIGKCDAIYVCDGWENSRGCRVEVECAKQYNKDIFYQTIPEYMTLREGFALRRKELECLSKSSYNFHNGMISEDTLFDFVNLFREHFSIT